MNGRPTQLNVLVAVNGYAVTVDFFHEDQFSKSYLTFQTSAELKEFLNKWVDKQVISSGL